MGGAATGPLDKAALVSQHQNVRAWMLCALQHVSHDTMRACLQIRRVKRAHGEYVSALNRVFPGKRGGIWYKQDTGNGPASEKGSIKRSL